MVQNSRKMVNCTTPGCKLRNGHGYSHSFEAALSQSARKRNSPAAWRAACPGVAHCEAALPADRAVQNRKRSSSPDLASPGARKPKRIQTPPAVAVAPALPSDRAVQNRKRSPSPDLASPGARKPKRIQTPPAVAVASAPAATPTKRSLLVGAHAAAAKSAYELEREETIRRNNVLLAHLFGAEIGRPAPSEEEQAAAALLRAERAAERAESLAQAFAQSRLSPRFAELPAGVVQVGNPLERQRPEPPRAPNLVRRAKAASIPSCGLDAEQRASLAGAAGWLEGMEEWLRPTHSADNTRTVMRAVRELASGQGIATGWHNANRIFYPSVPVDMATDFVALRAEANTFLPPERDPGHGWKFNHPIGKCMEFQSWLAQQR